MCHACLQTAYLDLQSTLSTGLYTQSKGSKALSLGTLQVRVHPTLPSALSSLTAAPLQQGFLLQKWAWGLGPQDPPIFQKPLIKEWSLSHLAVEKSSSSFLNHVSDLFNDVWYTPYLRALNIWARETQRQKTSSCWKMVAGNIVFRASMANWSSSRVHGGEVCCGETQWPLLVRVLNPMAPIYANLENTSVPAWSYIV